MLSSSYFESIEFNSGKNFNISRYVNLSYLGKLHWHPFMEILVSLADHNQVSVNFNKYPMGLNDILIIYPGDLHAIDACTEGSMLVIQFSDGLLSVMNALKQNLPLLSQYPFLKYEPGRAESDRMVLLIKEFFELSESKSNFREVGMYSILLHFFERLGNRCMDIKAENAEDVANGKNKNIKKMAEACLYISQNCTQPLTLDNVASYMGVSKSHFAHLFKEYTGTTFVDFLTEERIKHAQSLFLNPDTQIIDIAFDSGFSSISSFNRAFKKSTGLSPTKYRQTMIQDPE